MINELIQVAYYIVYYDIFTFNEAISVSRRATPPNPYVYVEYTLL